MAETVVSLLLEHLIPIIVEKIKEEVKLWTELRNDIEQLVKKLRVIVATIKVAEQKQLTDDRAKVFLEDLKDIAYDLEDLLDEWLTKPTHELLLLNNNQTSTHQVSLQRTGSLLVDGNGGVGGGGGGDSMNTKTTKLHYSLYYCCTCSCFNQLAFQRSMGGMIKDIKGRLDDITKDTRFLMDYPDGHHTLPGGQTQDQDGSLVDLLKIKGRDTNKDDLVRMLVPDKINNAHQNGTSSATTLPVISIKGKSGIGKTTLAQYIICDERVQDHFKNRFIWVSVNGPINDKNKLAREIIEVETKEEAPKYNQWGLLQNRLKECIGGDRFLLVLDNVWDVDSDQWNGLMLPLKQNGATGSMVLITTQIPDLESRMSSKGHSYMLDRISDDDSWLLICDIALQGKSEQVIQKVEKYGKELAKKCDGLPLSAKCLGVYMLNKERERDWHDVLKSDIWNAKGIKENLLRPLLISYFALNSDLKRCFTYCSFLPMDHQINKDVLIKLWMAQGFLGQTTDQMKKTGEEYFNTLAVRLFSQDFKEDDDGNKIISYKLHHHVHVLAQFLTGNECCFMENEISSKTRHSTLILKEENLDSVLSSLYQAEKLRTLKLYNSRLTSITIPNDLFSHFTRLRAFDVSNSGIVKLPATIEKLIHLRYLNLSGTMLGRLPETVCTLYNLQSLILNDCTELLELPEGIGEMNKLRHLEIRNTPQLRPLPEGIGKLTALRTLSRFIVQSLGKVRQLKGLLLLQGHLEISGLTRLKMGSEAEEADLKNKEQLDSLCFDFKHEEFTKVEGINDVLESLQPSPLLEKLEIHYYPGSTFPSWMKMTTVSILNNLCILTLKDCKKCTDLPALGKLSSLEEVRIENMDSVESIGDEFYGIKRNNDGPYTDETFPELKILHIKGMENLEKWCWNVRDRVSMPSLNHLFLQHCPKLAALPQNIFPPTLQEVANTFVLNRPL